MRSVTARVAAGALLGLMALVAAPAACLFPSYTFDLKGTTGTGGSTDTTTATGGTTTSSSSTGGTGGTGPKEDCLNGVDDDNDGLVDCEDPDCSPDYECVDEIPTGWSALGYVAFYEGTATPPSCPTDQPNAAYHGNDIVVASMPDCTACGCAAPTGQNCELLTDLDSSRSGIQALQVANAACNGSPTQNPTLSVPSPWDGICFHQESFPGGQLCNGTACNGSAFAAAPTVTGGTCAPTGGTAMMPLPKVEWLKNALACTGPLQGKGCTGKQVCLPKPKAPFESRVCVEKPGDATCPTGSAFSNKHLVYGGYDDTRICSGCTCGLPSGGSCEMTVHLYGDQTANDGCATEVVSVIGGQCTAIPGNAAIYGWKNEITKDPSGATCQPTSASTATGGVTAKSPTTFCCL